MRQKSTRAKEPAEKRVRDIRRRTRNQYSGEEKIRIVLEGLRGEDSGDLGPEARYVCCTNRTRQSVASHCGRFSGFSRS